MSTTRILRANSARKPQSSIDEESSTNRAAAELGGQTSKQPLKRPKRVKPLYTKFKRLENRQKTVDQNRRAVFAHLDEITRENIKLAKKGNSSIAKFLFEFAGINQVPALVKASSKAKKIATGAVEVDGDDPTKAVLSFNKKLGITPPQLKPPKPVEAEEQQTTVVG